MTEQIQLEKFDNLDTFPAVQDRIDAEGKLSRYVDTFCSKCHQRSVSAKDKGHDECDGPVFFVSKEFDRSSGVSMDAAQRTVNRVIDQLLNDGDYREETRTKLCPS